MDNKIKFVEVNIEYKVIAYDEEAYGIGGWGTRNVPVFNIRQDQCVDYQLPQGQGLNKGYHGSGGRVYPYKIRTQDNKTLIIGYDLYNTLKLIASEENKMIWEYTEDEIRDYAIMLKL